jgi:hypothetical protein
MTKTRGGLFIFILFWASCKLISKESSHLVLLIEREKQNRCVHAYFYKLYIDMTIITLSGNKWKKNVKIPPAHDMVKTINPENII